MAIEKFLDGLVWLGPSNRILDIDSNAVAIVDADIGLRIVKDRLLSFGRLPEDNNDAMQSYLANKGDVNQSFIIRSNAKFYVTLHGDTRAMTTNSYSLSVYRAFRIAVIDLSMQPDTTLLATMFGLSRSEEAVVDALITSSNASEAARSINLSRETVKSHLTSIYAKTGTRSLTQLMLLIGKLVYKT